MLLVSIGQHNSGDGQMEDNSVSGDDKHHG